MTAVLVAQVHDAVFDVNNTIRVVPFQWLSTIWFNDSTTFVNRLIIGCFVECGMAIDAITIREMTAVLLAQVYDVVVDRTLLATIGETSLNVSNTIRVIPFPWLDVIWFNNAHNLNIAKSIGYLMFCSMRHGNICHHNSRNDGCSGGTGV